jgi:CheY-like chemotaxis protein
MDKPVILLVEDDPDDVFFLQEALKKEDMSGALRVARDGEEAVAYLLGQGAFADRRLHPPPALVLLDLKLPRKSGLEVLEWRRGQAGMPLIPVIVLTSSVSNADISRAYELGANSYLIKPIESDAQQEMVRTILKYWIGLNKRPDDEPDG